MSVHNPNTCANPMAPLQRFRCLRPDHANVWDEHVLARDYDALATERDQLAAENARLREVLKPLAGIPLEEFGWGQHRPDQPITGWNKHTLYVRDVFAARAALAPATKEGQV